MFCKNCGMQLNDKAVACVGCGCDPRKGEKHCPNCGVAVEAAQVVCTKCGGALKAVQQQSHGADPVAKSKMAYLLLAIFIGEFGVHNFYAGYTNIGVIQLLVSLIGGLFTCGISTFAVWIWALVEGVTKDKDADGKPFGQ